MRFSGITISSVAQAGCTSGERKPSARCGWIICARGLTAAIALASITAVSAGAQSAVDSAQYARAQQMVANGDAANGRKLADSVAGAATPGSAAYAEGLFWRATLAANARDSEHEYRQIIVDYPLSGRVPAALLRIGQLEAARGENAAALQHFQRLALEHPLSPLRADGSYWVARMYFEGNDSAHGCAANADALASVRSTDVELKNRIDFQQQRCRGVVVAMDNNAVPPARETAIAPKDANEKAARKPASKEAVAPTRAETTAKVTAKPPAKASASSVANATHPAASVATELSADSSASSSSRSSSGVVNRQPTKEEVARALASAKLKVSPTAAASVERKSGARGSSSANATGDSARPAAKASTKSTEKAAAQPYAVQVAAFGAKGGATLLATKLHGRGYDAYVDGSRAPYRVRIGHYSSHAAAVAALAKLKAKHIDGFVVER